MSASILSHSFSEKSTGLSNPFRVVSYTDLLAEKESDPDAWKAKLAVQTRRESKALSDVGAWEAWEQLSGEIAGYEQVAREVNQGIFYSYYDLSTDEKQSVKFFLGDFSIIRLDGWKVEPDLMVRFEKIMAEIYKIDAEFAIQHATAERNKKEFVISHVDGTRYQALQNELYTIAHKVEISLSRYEREQTRLKDIGVIDTDIDSEGEPPPELIKGLALDLYPNTIALLVGLSGSRKSYLALMAAGSMRNLGGNVSYWMNEGSKANMKGRYKAYKEEYPLDETGGYMTIVDSNELPLNLMDDESVTRFIDYMRPQNLSMLVIDALTGSYLGDENSNTDLAVAMDGLRRIKDELGVTLLVCDNTGKDTSKGARGGQVKFDKSDTVITVEKKMLSTGNERTVATYKKQKFGVAGKKVNYRWEQHTIKQGDRFILDVAPIVDTKIDWKEDIYDYISFNQPVNQAGIIDGLKGNKTTVRGYLKDLVDESKIEADDKGYYSLLG